MRGGDSPSLCVPARHCDLGANRPQGKLAWHKEVGLRATFVSLALVLAACGRDTGSAGSAAPAAAAGAMPSFEKVCALVEPAEVEAVLGAKVGKPEEPPPQAGIPEIVGMRYCTFGDLGKQTLTVGLSSGLGTQVFKEAVTKLTDKYVFVAPVYNLGDEALAFFGGFLVVRDGPYVAYLGVTRQDENPLEVNRFEAAPQAVRERNVSLALGVLERLPKVPPK